MDEVTIHITYVVSIPNLSKIEYFFVGGLQNRVTPITALKSLIEEGFIHCLGQSLQRYKNENEDQYIYLGQRNHTKWNADRQSQSQIAPWPCCLWRGDGWTVLVAIEETTDLASNCPSKLSVAPG